MHKSEIKSLLISHQSIFQDFPDPVPRLSLSCLREIEKGNGITFILGPRNAGKTTLLKQIASSLEGIKIYIDFEDSRLKQLGSEIFQAIENSLNEIIEQESGFCEQESANINVRQIYYFLDEIHNIPGWDSWIDSLNNQGAGVFITSSSSNLIKQELSKRFKDRIKLLNLFPFSFKEYLLLRYSVVPNLKAITPSLSDGLLCSLLQYFENGGFPEVIKTRDIRLCKKYFEEILQQGDAAGYDIQDMDALKKLSLFLVSNMACEYSFKTLETVSGAENEETVQRYLDFLEDNFLFYRIPMLNSLPESRENKSASHKIYVSDTGFFKALYPNYPDSLGLRFENLIFLELLRQEKKIFYFRNRSECDFLIMNKGSQKVSAAIQASVHFGSQAVREREVQGLMEAMEAYGLEEGLILTMDDEEILRAKGKDGMKKIVVKPAWKWMLE